MTEETMLELRRAVVFAILTQDMEAKPPGYVQSKWLAVKESSSPEQLLDPVSKAKLEDWRRGWRNCLPKEEEVRGLYQSG